MGGDHMAKGTGNAVIAQNKKAYHDYFIEDKFEAGIELRKKYGADAVCDFSLGNPDLAPPAEAARAMAALAERLSHDFTLKLTRYGKECTLAEEIL